MDLKIPEKVLQYEIFVNEVLKEDLKRVNNLQNELNSEIAEYLQLKNSIQMMSKLEGGFKSKMDLGCNFYIQANVLDTSQILINIGLNHYVEYTLDEALKHIENKIHILTLQSEKLRKTSAQTKALTKLVLGGLQQLQFGNPV